MGMPGPMEWGIILLIVLLIFGGKKLPQLGRSLGLSIKNFRKGISNENESDNDHDSKGLNS